MLASASVAGSDKDERFVGRSLGDFVVRRQIGAGGFGAVYLAEQQALGREAVIKVPLRRATMAPEFVARFLREARIASRLDHPYAAHIYAFGSEPDGTLWTAMEFVRGQPLNELLKQQGPLPVERFCRCSRRSARSSTRRTSRASCTATSSRPTSWCSPAPASSCRSCSTSASPSSMTVRRAPAPRRR
jgi:hypothetical protein